MSIAFAIVVALLCAYGLLWLFVLWVGEGMGRRWATFETERAHAAIRPRDRIAIHATCGPFIQMPDHVKTRDEMVAWMTRELPRLIEGEHNLGR